VKVRLNMRFDAQKFEWGMEDGYRYSPPIGGFTSDIITKDSVGYNPQIAIKMCTPPIEVRPVLVISDMLPFLDIHEGDYIITDEEGVKSVVPNERFDLLFEVIDEKPEHYYDGGCDSAMHMRHLLED